MKNLTPFSFFGLLTCLLALASCNPDEDFQFNYAEPQRTYLHIVNANANVEAVDFLIETDEGSSAAATRLEFLDSWPGQGYASLLTRAAVDSTSGESNTRIRVAERASGEEVIAATDWALLPDSYRTFFLIDSIGKPKLVRTLDQFRELPRPDSFANVRFTNLNYTVLSVTLRDADTSFQFLGLNFLNFEGFVNVRAGDYDLEFVNDVNEVVIARVAGTEFIAGRTYDVILTQEGGAPRVLVAELRRESPD